MIRQRFNPHVTQRPVSLETKIFTQFSNVRMREFEWQKKKQNKKNKNKTKQAISTITTKTRKKKHLL